MAMAQKTITIDVARKKLGKNGKLMTDKQVFDLLSTLKALSNKAIDSAIEQSNSPSKL